MPGAGKFPNQYRLSIIDTIFLMISKAKHNQKEINRIFLLKAVCSVFCNTSLDRREALSGSASGEQTQHCQRPAPDTDSQKSTSCTFHR